MATKQPLKKKTAEDINSIEARKSALAAFKQKNNLVGAKEKDLEWYPLSKAYQDAVRLPGIPKGYVSAIRGHSNTGKSTVKLELIKAVQKAGDVPVIFELENNFSWTHAKDIGVSVNEYVDEETGEITYGPDDMTLYYDTAKLYEIYGCYNHEDSKYDSKPKRETYVIEDVALCIRELLRKQREGELPFNMVFIIDSIGVGDCYRAAVKNGTNNMWYAGAVSSCFNTITNDLIPSSRNVNSEYTNSMFIVNKIWVSQTPTGLPSANSKGGSSLGYAYRLLLFVGGIAGPSIKALTATSGGREYQYGVRTKIRVEKNHINNLTYTGEICALQQGLWNPDELDSYKKQYAGFIKSKLAEDYGIDVNEIGELSYAEVDKDE